MSVYAYDAMSGTTSQSTVAARILLVDGPVDQSPSAVLSGAKAGLRGVAVVSGTLVSLADAVNRQIIGALNVNSQYRIDVANNLGALLGMASSLSYVLPLLANDYPDVAGSLYILEPGIVLDVPAFGGSLWAEFVSRRDIDSVTFEDVYRCVDAKTRSVGIVVTYTSRYVPGSEPVHVTAVAAVPVGLGPWKSIDAGALAAQNCSALANYVPQRLKLSTILAGNSMFVQYATMAFQGVVNILTPIVFPPPDPGGGGDNGSTDGWLLT